MSMDSPSRIDCGPCVLRPWRDEDAASLVHHANDAAVSWGLADRFPFPYTAADARDFLALPLMHPAERLAVEIGGAAVGGIGFRYLEDVFRSGAQVGYWLGRAHWGRGVMSTALAAYCEYLFAHRPFERVQAYVYAGNAASARVLEKCRFVREGWLRRAVIKRGQCLDAALYARLRAEAEATAYG